MKKEPNDTIPEIIRFANIFELNLVSSEISSGKTSVHISSKEMCVLILLINARKPITTAEIIERVWKGRVSERDVWIVISRLRSKFSELGLPNVLPKWQEGGYILNVSTISNGKLQL